MNPETADEAATRERRFAETVKQMRTERGWSQEHLADKMRRAGVLNATQVVVSRIEQGTRDVRLAEALALSAIFDTPVSVMASLGSAWTFAAFSKINHSAHRRSYVELKRALSEFTKSKERNRSELPDLRKLRETAGDPEERAMIDNLIRNMEQFDTLLLRDEVAPYLERADGDGAADASDRWADYAQSDNSQEADDGEHSEAS